MPPNKFIKLFTLSEANDLIPSLEQLVRELQLAAAGLRGSIAELSRDNFDAESSALADLVRRYPQLSQPATQMASAIEKIESLGCFLKDIELGLVDIPCELTDNKVVFLCWQSGESAVLAWHPVEAGFAQRQALPGVNKQYLN